MGAHVPTDLVPYILQIPVSGYLLPRTSAPAKNVYYISYLSITASDLCAAWNYSWGLVLEVYHIASLTGSSIVFSTSGCASSWAVLGMDQPASLTGRRIVV